MVDEPIEQSAPAKAETRGRARTKAGDPLTPHQQEIWDLRQAGKLQGEIALALGISKPVVNRTIGVIYKKIGMKPIKAHRLMEEIKPEKAAAVIDALTEPDPYLKIKEAFALAGLPNPVSDKLIRRLRIKYNSALMEVKSLKTQEILDLLNRRIHLGLQYLDDKVMAEASARDIMLGLGVMIEKRQLLRGEPTQIISDHERKKLHELLPALIAEGQRRGITIEGEVVKVVNAGAPT